MLNSNHKAFYELQQKFGESNSSKIQKQTIIDNEQILLDNLELVYFIYYPNIKHGMTYTKFLEWIKNGKIEIDEIIDILHREIPPATKAALIRGLPLLEINYTSEESYILEMIFDKKSRFNVGKTLMAKYIQLALDKFEPNRKDFIEGMKGYDSSKILMKDKFATFIKEFKTSFILASIKMDGYRALAHVKVSVLDGIASYNKLEITTIDKLKNTINEELVAPLLKQGYRNFVIDMELGIWLEDMSEMFSACTTRIKCLKEDRCQDIICFPFDICFRDEPHCLKPLEERIKILQSCITSNQVEIVHNATPGMTSNYKKTINILDQKIIKCSKDLIDYFDFVLNLGFEGLIIRNPLSIYETKRSKNMFKMKPMMDFEVTVTDTIMGTVPMLTKGIMVDTPCVVSLVFNLDDKIFNVGSGLSNKLRLLFIDKSEIVGKDITIRVMEMIKDSNGKEYPRFPRFKSIYQA